ncbi:MAG: TIR domain-containing protein [Maricaulaceae bacterium]
MHNYVGFISYAHADNIIAKRLQNHLETFKLPKNLKTLATRQSLSPLFRDATELSAHHNLNEKIHEAIKNSQYLIVLCSPAAKASFWVNEEIRLFQKHHGDAAILCVLAEGTPDTAFPPALIEKGQEPLAATLEGGRDGFRLGTTQLAAAMFGLGLDQLIRRDAQRRRRQTQVIVSLALFFSSFMGLTAYGAIKARNAAVTNRTEAESLVQYMIGDLKNKLVPLGRLDVLDGMGEKIKLYYGNSDIDKMPNARLFRYARALHLLTQVEIDAGKYDKAEIYAREAAAITERALERDRNYTTAIYNHSQSQYWLGAVKFKKGNFENAFPFWDEYKSLSHKLYETRPDNFNWVIERANGENNIALLHHRLRNFEKSENFYETSIKFFDEALTLNPENLSASFGLANVYSGIARVALIRDTPEMVKHYRTKQIKIYQKLRNKHPQNKHIQYRIALSKVNYLNDVITNEIDLITSPDSLQALASLRQLIEHEPDNTDWLKTFANHNYNILSIRQNRGLSPPKIEEWDQLISYIEVNPNSVNLIPVLQGSQIRRHIATGNLKLAQNELSLIKPIQTLKDEDHLQSLSRLNIFMNLNYQLGDINRAEKFASITLKSPVYTYEQNLPATLKKKIDALTVLNKCLETDVLLKKLKVRNYNINMELSTCKRRE